MSALPACRPETEPAPHLHSPARLAVSARDAEAMAAIVAAHEALVALPGYRAAVLARAPAAARHETVAAGVFMGYDFHLAPAGPRLIEINTNAGGALLHACHAGIDAGPAFFAMFAEEWRRQRGDGLPRCVAIVDDRPEAQFLYPEFLLFRRLFERHGVRAMIADAAELEWRDGTLRHRGQAIDLVYNRLTDFALAEPAHAALRQAWLADAVVLSPHPRAHALYADKRNLALLCDRDALLGFGLDAAAAEILAAAVPATVAVTPDKAEALWQDRRRLFFKPAEGYGSKGAYRGDKLTTRVWGEILQGGYVAQEFVRPGEIGLGPEHGGAVLKCDLRNYAYRGRVQLLAARLYQGQTTNFRTPGGGFAAVDVVADHWHSG